MKGRDELRAEVLEFLARLDEHLEVPEPIDVYIGGGAAVLLAYEGQLATVDVDFIGQKAGVLLELSELAKKNSAIHESTHLYLDIVPPGLFPSDFGWKNRTLVLDLPKLNKMRVRVLEIHDLIISKLKRFAPKDRQDIRALCETHDVDIATLRARYRGARQLRDYDEREKMDAHFRVVEAEYLGHEPSVFE
jgi:hypothetical protein